MLNIEDKSKCCGCHACVNICPTDCIKMDRDKDGFLYPKIDEEICINCGLCEKACPEINIIKEVPFKQDGYLVQIKDDEIRMQSTAGGAFTAIARNIIHKGGVVYGVTMDEDFIVKHIGVKTERDLYKFRNSKYVQSKVGDETFKEIKTYLKNDKVVCFSGTPCQIEGLKCFLQKDYKNLITVDVVCRAVPSPKVFEKYLEFQNNKIGEKIATVRFRDKYYGYKYSTMNLNGTRSNWNYHKGIESDEWLRTFFSSICNRPSCYSCSFKKRYRVSDFTIWDCFDVYKFSKNMDDDKGTTKVLIHTDKGRNLFEEIKENINFLNVEPEKLVEGVKEMFESKKMHPRRQEFVEDLDRLTSEELFRKYFPNTFKVKTKRTLRLTLNKIGIYPLVKKTYVKYLKRD